MNERFRGPEQNPGETETKLFYSLKNDSARLDICEVPERGEIIRIRNEGGGEWVELNSLLPKDYKFKFVDETAPLSRRTRCDDKNKTIELLERDFKNFNNWSDLLMILHEIAHAQNYQESLDSKHLLELQSQESAKPVRKRYTAEFSKEFNQLRSIDERNAWAGAIKMFRSLLKEIELTPEELSLTEKKVEEFVHKMLSDQKEFALMAEKDRGGEEGDSLRQIISGLYTKTK